MKYIREGRFGPPKCYKTGAVVSSYPKPMLVLNFDEGGLDVVQTPVTYIKPAEIDAFCAKKVEELPPITAIDFCDAFDKLMTLKPTPVGNSVPMEAFVTTANKLVQKGCPWRTIVVDNITGLSEVILAHIAKDQAASMTDPRKWAGSVGNYVAKTLGFITALNAHTVFIIHSTTEKNEVTGEVSILPMIYSKVRDRVGGLLSQFFYQTVEGGKTVVYTQAAGLVKGIGARWPANLPAKCGPLFSDIYGKSLEQQPTP